MNIPNKIIIHHSAGPDNTVLKDFDAIRNYHINVNKWKDIGYHWVIESIANEYKIIPGRSESMEGAHCPKQNQQSIGVCVVGDFSNTEPTDAQYLTLVYCIKDIFKRYGELPVYGHRDFYNTECPGKLNIDKVRNLLSPKEVKQLTTEEAIQVLADNGVISSPDYWLKSVTVVNNLDKLIINMAAKLTA